MPASRNISSRARPAEMRSLMLLASLLVLVGLLGGSSRYDAFQLAVLRPLCGILFAVGLYQISREQLMSQSQLVFILGLWSIWMAIQLIPLPPSFWQSLPGRETIVRLDQIAGHDGVWRPISMTPTRGFNAFLSLIVPAAALLSALATNARSRLLLQLVALLGVADAVLGLLQVMSGRGSVLYSYAITNAGYPVGIFANENHSAVFSAIVMLAIARLGATAASADEQTWLRISYAPAFILAMLAILVSGSRAGLVMGLLALLVSGALVAIALGRIRPVRAKKSIALPSITLSRHVLITIFVGTIALLIAAFAFLGRAPGLEGVVSQDPMNDLRLQLLPIFVQMIGDHWLLGAGFGSFDRVYMIYEPTALLMPRYVNQAHNEFAQMLIEGGIPAVALLLALIVWLSVAIWQVTSRATDGFSAMLFWGAVIAILGAASVIDYPLRTPIFQLVGVWLLVGLSIERAQLPQKSVQRSG